MADYKTIYHKMFNAMTDAGQLVDKAATIMKTAQIECEDIYTEADGTPIILSDNSITKQNS